MHVALHRGILVVIGVVLTAGVCSGCAGSGAELGKVSGSSGPNANPPTYVRECDPGIGSDRISATDGDLVLGNARLYIVGQHARRSESQAFRRGKELGGPWRAFKTLVLLNGPRATLRVSRPDRTYFLLAYDPSRVKDFAYARGDGQAEVMFVNCHPPLRNLEFPGALLARRPGCYRVEAVSGSGALVASGIVNIAMGRGKCGAKQLKVE